VGVYKNSDNSPLSLINVTENEINNYKSHKKLNYFIYGYNQISANAGSHEEEIYLFMKIFKEKQISGVSDHGFNEKDFELYIGDIDFD